MFPNIAISLLGTLLPAIINSASAPVPDAVTKKAASAGVLVPNVNSTLVGLIASTAIAALGAAGFGDVTHTAMLVLGGLGAAATAVGHSSAIGASDHNTLSTIGALMTQISQLQADNAALGGLAAGTAPDVVLSSSPVSAAPAPVSHTHGLDPAPIGAIS